MTASEQRDSEDFRAGMSYAADVILLALGMVPGGDPLGTVAAIEPRPCCRRAVIAFALGAAAGLQDSAQR